MIPISLEESLVPLGTQKKATDIQETGFLTMVAAAHFYPMFFTVEKLVKSGYFAWAFSFSQRLSDPFCYLSIG